MAYRSWGNFQGDRGEIEALSELLKTGAAINTLTASDTGWDLHLHLPEHSMFIDTDPPSEVDNRYLKWRLSGRTAHVQVKRDASGKGY